MQFLDSKTGKYLSGLFIATLRERLGLDPGDYSATKKSDTRAIAAACFAKYGVKNPVKDATFGVYCLSLWDWDHSIYIKGQKPRATVIRMHYVGYCHSCIARLVVPDKLGKPPSPRSRSVPGYRNAPEQAPYAGAWAGRIIKQREP